MRYLNSTHLAIWLFVPIVAASDMEINDANRDSFLQLQCGKDADIEQVGHYGPYDYSNPDHFNNKLKLY